MNRIIFRQEAEEHRQTDEDDAGGTDEKVTTHNQTHQGEFPKQLQPKAVSGNMKINNYRKPIL